MTRDFLLPDLGEGLTEAELVQWRVAAGDDVALNQTIAEVETAKAVVELPSPFAGTVRTLHAEPGAVITVGSPLITIADAASTGPSEAETAETVDAEPIEAGRSGTTANLVGYGAAPAQNGRPQRRSRKAQATATAADTGLLEVAPHDAPHDALRESERIEPPLERPRAAPPVRKLAKDLGVDLARVEPYAEGELITRGDVQEYAARRDGDDALGAAAEHDSPDETVRIPVRGVRKHTAAAMVRSAFTAPHATTFLTIDVTATSELIASVRADRAAEGSRISLLAVVAKAACLAMPRTPDLNAWWDEDAGEIVRFRDVHLGIAAATDRGLVVPVLRAADRMPLAELAERLSDLVRTARDGRTAPADLRGSTFSLTNIGALGVDGGTPILNPGEAGILAIGAVRRLPWEHEGEVALRDVMTLSLSFDHRVVDGQQAAQFLTDVGGVLREPGRAMMLR